MPEAERPRGGRSPAPMTVVSDETPDASGYIDAGGVHTYYDVQGSGDPLILLNGGFATIETWRGQSPALAEHFRVYLPELRGHGRTPDVKGPTGFAIMALDTVTFNGGEAERLVPAQAARREQAQVLGGEDLQPHGRRQVPVPGPAGQRVHQHPQLSGGRPHLRTHLDGPPDPCRPCGRSWPA
jgi:hypothetical protein